MGMERRTNILGEIVGGKDLKEYYQTQLHCCANHLLQFNTIFREKREKAKNCNEWHIMMKSEGELSGNFDHKSKKEKI